MPPTGSDMESLVVSLTSQETCLTSIEPNCRRTGHGIWTFRTDLDRGTCQETLGQTTFSYLVFITQLATDWIFVFIPSIIVAAAHTRRRQKVLMAGVLGLGAVASVSACFRVPFLRFIDISEYPEDYLCELWALILLPYLSPVTDLGRTYIDHLGMINISSNIECGLGVIACSLPPLRRLFRCCNSSQDGIFNYSGEVRH